MKISIPPIIANLFRKPVDVETYKTRLQILWTEYKNWWFPALSSFRKEYEEAHGSIFGQDYPDAEDEFEHQLRSKNDVLSQFYKFMDESYMVYMNATPKERAEIRIFIGKQSSTSYYFEDLIRKYVRDHIIQQIQLTGKNVWLIRGLVAISLENSGVDYRDTLVSLAQLYSVAEEKGLKPKNDFHRIADISGEDVPPGGTTPMRKLMAGISSSAILREQRSERK